jgi:hypothetical protein
MYSNQTNIKSISSSENLSFNKANNGIYLEDNRKNQSLQFKSLGTKFSHVHPVVQLAKSITKPKKDSLAEQRKKERAYLAKPWKKYDDKLESIKSKVFNGKIELKSIEERLEDDEDIDLLDTYFEKLKRISSDASSTRRKIRTESMGRTRSQNSGQTEHINQLDYYPIEIAKLLKEVKLLFPTHSGGFGAKGRAHKMEVKIDPANKKGLKLDNSFVNNFSTDGKSIKQNIYKKAPKVAKEKAKNAIIGGKQSSTIKDKDKALGLLEKKLDGIVTPQVANFKNTPVGMGRGDGQYANMANTNAAGYAYLANVPSWETQRWEWLHIRGAGLGGKTDGSNLVAGTRDANTHMIPFESNIRTLATAVATNKNYKSLDVEWSANSQFGAAKHAFREIGIEWRLNRKNNKVKDIRGVAKFNPLVVGSNISKTEVDLIEAALKEVRDSI